MSQETTTRPFYGFVNGDNDFDPREPTFDLGGMDCVSWERFFHELPVEQLEVLYFLYMGYKPKEIAKKLKYKNIVRFYNVSAKLRTMYRERKTAISDV